MTYSTVSVGEEFKIDGILWRYNCQRVCVLILGID